MSNMVQPQVQQRPQQQQPQQQEDPMGGFRPFANIASMFFPQVGMAMAAYDFLRTGKPGQNSLLGMLGVGQGHGDNPFIKQLLGQQQFNPYGGGAMGGAKSMWGGGGGNSFWDSATGAGLNNPGQFDMTGGFM